MLNYRCSNISNITKFWHIISKMILIITGFTFLAVMKDKNNGCIAGLIANMYKYMKGQKFYGYVLKEKKEND